MESGTWEPQFNVPLTVRYQDAYYTRIGPLVYIHLQALIVDYESFSEYVSITGLPYSTIKSDAGFGTRWHALALGFAFNQNPRVAYGTAIMSTDSDGDIIRLIVEGGGGTVSYNSLPSYSFQFSIAGSYMIDV